MARKTTKQDMQCTICVKNGCARHNYHIVINKRTIPKLELSKFCPVCRKSELHVAKDMKGGKAGNAAGGNKKK